MEVRRIGSLEVSAVGLGCNNFGRRLDETDTKRVIDAALDAGITLLDTADIYGGTKSESFIGQARSPSAMFRRISRLDMLRLDSASRARNSNCRQRIQSAFGPCSGKKCS